METRTVSLTKTTGIAIVVLVLTFLAGAAVGVFGAHMAILHGGAGAERFPRALLNRLDRRLDLTDQQRAQIAKIINTRHARIASEVRGEVDRANEEIERVLTPEQRVKFQKMRMRMGGGMPHHP
jgi:Spy/CpxP family protein refolding chaperone